MFGLTASSKDPWPLKFERHNFGVRCYNTLHCRVLYNNFNFTRLYELDPSGVPERPNWQDDWSAGHIIGHRFAPPVEAWWTSLDGSEHHTEVDLAELFEDRLVRHHVAKNDIPEGWLAAKAVNPLPVQILMEVNDRTVSVYMKALIITKEPQIPNNPHSNGRNDLVLIWMATH